MLVGSAGSPRRPSPEHVPYHAQHLESLHLLVAHRTDSLLLALRLAPLASGVPRALLPKPPSKPLAILYVSRSTRYTGPTAPLEKGVIFVKVRKRFVLPPDKHIYTRASSRARQHALSKPREARRRSPRRARARARACVWVWCVLMAALPSCFSAKEHFADVLNGSWSVGQSLPHASHPACPFSRPWDNCAYDDKERGARVGGRRYNPTSCALDAFDAAAMHRALAGRLLLFVGDSVQVQLFSAFACMLHAHDPLSVKTTNIRWRSPETLRKRCHGEQKCHYEQACVEFTSGARVCVCPVIGLEDRLYARCLAGKTRSSDIVFYGSIGIHFTGEMGSNGSRIDVTKLATKEAALLLRHVGYSSHRRRATSPTVIWREVTAQHFPHAGGHYKQASAQDDYNRKTNDPRPCTTTHSYVDMERHQRWNKVALPIVEQANIPILRVWASTALVGDAHVSYGDCTHFCIPGAPNEWAKLFGAMLRRLDLPPPAQSAAAAAAPRGRRSDP